ncbi:electron transport complex protein RnfA [Klebsiella pneumoniae subsp. pneumoniae]|uniref:Electron transport complex protein RnfA n=1 Tax=Klebsiella pneumoniae subsp. pneumoniae TaxID=72407 RepID=A0A377ZJ74_KLEPN|nr:electron transport complex protein RnfA [Klebsiella pneumoniae subsp. pneumoniae]
MADYLLLFIGTVLVNNFVLVKFLGLCPFMGFPKSWKPQWGWARYHLRDDPGLYLRLAD